MGEAFAWSRLSIPAQLNSMLPASTAPLPTFLFFLGPPPVVTKEVCTSVKQQQGLRLKYLRSDRDEDDDGVPAKLLQWFLALDWRQFCWVARPPWFMHKGFLLVPTLPRYDSTAAVSA
ncbi:unnamed protein product [Caretta caretta]